MMSRYGNYFSTPPVVLNLLIINILFFMATALLPEQASDTLINTLGLHFWRSSEFNYWQLLTYMFLHSNFTHLFMNMFALWMFGRTIESYWGGKRFLIYYLVTAIGAGLIQEAVYSVRIYQIVSQLSPELVDIVKNEGLAILQQSQNYTDKFMGSLNLLLNMPTVGASGGVFGILLAFGMMFPNALIYIYLLFPVKAKWLVVGYGVLELWLGIANRSGDNVAHFAHLGGMIFGFFLLLLWKKQGKIRY